MLRALLLRCGLHPVGETGGAVPLSRLVLASGADVAVASLPSAGLTDLATLRALRAEVPHSTVVLVSPFAQLAAEAVEAGAWALVQEDDPRALRDVLLELVAAARGQEAAGSAGSAAASPLDPLPADASGRVRRKPRS
jgi:AmiR/NasT family two-component response regulator